MKSRVIKFWMLAGATYSMSNIVNAMSTTEGPSSSDNLGSDVNALPSSSSGIFDRNKAWEAAVTLGTEVELTISAKKLAGLHGSSGRCVKPDPMCVISTLTESNHRWTEYQRTEFLADNRNPQFAKKVVMPYSPFYETLKLMFTVYTYFVWGSGEAGRQDHDFLGYASCRLGDLVGQGKLELQLKGKKIESGREVNMKGQVVVYAEKLIDSHHQIVLRLAGTNLIKKLSSFKEPNRYIEIYKRSTISEEYVLVYRTEVVRRSSNPRWEPITIPLKRLCNGHYERSLKFVCWEWKEFIIGNRTSRKFVGAFNTTLDEIAAQNTRNKRTFTLQNRKNVLRKEYGQIEVDFEVIEAPSFSEFIRAGLQVRCVIAVHFSGDPSNIESMHHRADVNDVTSLNQLEKVLVSLVDVLADFDWEKKFSFLGFGNQHNGVAKDDNHDEIESDYDVVVDFTDCGGIQDALDAYRKNLAKFDFDGTDLISVIHTIASIVKVRSTPQDYFILFVLVSSGRISDVDEFEKIVTEASTLPISIIVLSLNERPALSPENKAEDGSRNIVHTLSFSECRSNNDDYTHSCLATKLLAELPSQVLSYMRSKNYSPTTIMQESRQPDATEEVFSSRVALPAIPRSPKASSSRSSNLEIVPAFAPDENVPSLFQPSSFSSHSNGRSSSLSNLPLEPLPASDNVSQSRSPPSTPRPGAPFSSALNLPSDSHEKADHVPSSSTVDAPSSSVLNLPHEPHLPADDTTARSSTSHSSNPSISNVWNPPLEPSSPTRITPSSEPSSPLTQHPRELDNNSETSKIKQSSTLPTSNLTIDEKSPFVSGPSSEVVANDSSHVELVNPNASPIHPSSPHTASEVPTHSPLRTSSDSVSSDSSAYKTPRSHYSEFSDSRDRMSDFSE